MNKLRSTTVWIIVYSIYHQRFKLFHYLTFFSYTGNRKLIDIAFLTMFGFDFNEASFLYVLLYAKCAGGMITLIDDQFPGNAQEYKVKVKHL